MGVESLSEPQRSTRILTVPRYAGEGNRRLPPLSTLSADGGGWGGGQVLQPRTERRLRLTRLAPPDPPPLRRGGNILALAGYLLCM